MKRIILLFSTILILETPGNSQVAINTDGSIPNSSSMLDIKSVNKGLLIPRVNLSSETDVATIPSPQFSLLIFNTNSALPDGNGYYFWNASKWSKLATRTNLENLAWGVTGNTGTNASTHFIGTSDSRPLVFKTNNILSGKIDPGPNNVFFGQSAGVAITDGTNNTFLGHLAGAQTTTGSANFFAGHLAGNDNSSGGANVFIGQEAGKTNRTGSFNVYIGEDAGINNGNGSESVLIGNGAGRAATAISGMLGIGFNALASNLGGVQNTAIGHSALLSNRSGAQNTAVGYHSLKLNVDAPSNTAIGSLSLEANTTGIQNTAVGSKALVNNEGGHYNVAIGQEAMALNVNGEENTAVGNKSLISITRGSRNTVLGSNADVFFGFLFNSTAIGANAKVASVNTMVFGDEDVDRWAFGLTSTNANHALEVGDNNTNGNGAYLTQGGTWTNACDANKKEDFSDIDGDELLQKIAQLNVQRWKYKGTNEYHVGPTAQDFYRAFRLGTDEKGISTVDAPGIALSAIQQLTKEIITLKKENESLKKRMEVIER